MIWLLAVYLVIGLLLAFVGLGIASKDDEMKIVGLISLFLACTLFWPLVLAFGAGRNLGE